MVTVEKERTETGRIIKVLKNDKALLVSQNRNYDLLISLFDKNYPRIFNVDINDDTLYYIIDDLYNEIKKINNNFLFYNDIIDYHSDDEKYEYASRFIIVKEDNGYNIIMTGNQRDNSRNSVRISGKNSRYNNDNYAFFKMYNDLNIYDLKSKKLVK